MCTLWVKCPSLTSMHSRRQGRRLLLLPWKGTRCTLTHGRLYIRNLPWSWGWRDCERWINGHHFPNVKFLKMFYGQDLGSCYAWTRAVLCFVHPVGVEQPFVVGAACSETVGNVGEGLAEPADEATRCLSAFANTAVG